MCCPHCAVTVHPDWEHGWIADIPDSDASWQWAKMYCPSCHNMIIKVRLQYYTGGQFPGDEVYAADREVWVEPSTPKRAPVGEGVPSEFVVDYEEALAVLPVSPKASAALSRRVLQSIMWDQGYDGRNLAAQIDKLLAETRGDKVLPTSVQANVDVIRNVGNFAAHAITDDTTLQVIPVSREEAEWCLTIIENLFEHYYVIPAAHDKLRDEFNQRLVQAGKTPIKS